MKAKRALRIAASYIGLIQDLSLQVNPALAKLYAYRMGCGTLGDPGGLITQQLQQVGNAQSQLKAYANSCVIFNVRSYVALMTRMIQDRVIDRPEEGVHNEGPDRPPEHTLHLSPETAQQVARFTAIALDQTRPPGRDPDSDIIGTIARGATIDSMNRFARYPSSDAVVFDLLKVADRFAVKHEGSDYTLHHVPLLKTLFAIACLNYGVSPVKLRTKQDPSRQRTFSISDSTLACLPTPTPDLVELFCEPTAGPVSRLGSEYYDAFARFVSVNPM